MIDHLESVKCRFSKCRFSAELEKLENIFKNQDGGQRRKIYPKGLGFVLSLCCHAGIDAALEKANFFFAGVPIIENKVEQKIQNTKVASAVVAFDTVRTVEEASLYATDKDLTCAFSDTVGTGLPLAIQSLVAWLTVALR